MDEKAPQMHTLAIALIVLSINGAILWMLSGVAPSGYAMSLGAATVVANLLLGIRLGYDAARAYFQDVARLNRYLSDQNEELVASNRELLERVGDSFGDSPSAGEQPIAEPGQERSRERRKGA